MKKKLLLEARVSLKAGAAKTRKTVCDKGFIWASLQTIGLILFYYLFSISLTFYNQRVIHHFKFPLSLSMAHFLLKFVVSGLVRLIMHKLTGVPRVTLSWKMYIINVAPPGIFSALDIGLSNWSFEFITVSLYTMTKSTVIIFILGFSILFKLEKLRCSLIAVVLLISSGLFLFTFKLTQFSLEGFLMALAASFLSGLRWTLSQLLLQRADIGLQHPIDMMYHIQPWMMLAMLPISAPIEGLRVATNDRLFGFTDSSLLASSIGLVFLGGFLAFFLELSEYLLVRFTSGLTLSVSGVFKEICQLVLACLINGDRLGLPNVLGLLLCLIGITLHVLLKACHKEEGKHELDPAVSQLISPTEDEESEQEEFSLANHNRNSRTNR